MRAAIPALIATGAWGLVTGVAMVNSGLTFAQALGMSLLVYAGSAQLAALPLIAADAPVWVVVLAATVLNLRFVIFSAALYPYLRRLPLHRRLLLGYITADFGFAVSMARWAQAPPQARGSPEQLWFLAGVTTSTWVIWQSMSLLGIVAGARVPTTWGLDFLPPLALLALTVPMLNSKPALAGAAAAAAVAVAGAGLPLKLGLLAAVLPGVAAAFAAEEVLSR
ncbi:MAG: AzlC family ABC transporter permease [Burkholderiaceae bacterium]|nr:AzlC family ABC transporter permease [Burkholderiaceae bacterium]